MWVAKASWTFEIMCLQHKPQLIKLISFEGEINDGKIESVEQINDLWFKLNLVNYYNYINNIINTRGKYNISNNEYEVHHIILRSFNGLPAKIKHTSQYENLIWLTYAEHYEVHKILALDNLDNYNCIYAHVNSAKWTINH